MDRPKVLAIDKDRASLAGIERALCEVGFDVAVAWRGEEALRMLRDGGTDVVVCGPEVEEGTVSLKAIRECDLDVAIVVWGARRAVEAFAEAGEISGCVLKSSEDVEELVAVVEESLRRRRAVLDAKRTIKAVLAANRRLAAEKNGLEAVHRRVRQKQKGLIQRAKEEAVQEMVGAVNHELNQPLCVIMGKAELLLRSMDHEDPNYKTVESIHRTSERMAELVRKIGSFKQYRTKPYVGTQQIVDIDQACIPVG